MRIRKNTKLSSMMLLATGGERAETYVCHLNQSPWDVIPMTNLLDSSWFLPSPSSSSSLSPPVACKLDGGEDSFNGNASLADSAERFNSSVDQLNLIAAADYDVSPDFEEPMDLSEPSGEKSRAVEISYPGKTSGDDEPVPVTMPAPPKRGRPRGTAKKAPSSTASSKNPYEFYYYSGFGPRWGRKRGGSGDDEKVIMGDDESKKSSSSSEEEEADDKTAAFGGGSGSLDEYDYVEEEDNVCDLMDQDSDDDHGMKFRKEKMTMKKTKRARKPVKERSLKSLM